MYKLQILIYFRENTPLIYKIISVITLCCYYIFIKKIVIHNVKKREFILIYFTSHRVFYAQKILDVITKSFKFSYSHSTKKLKKNF